MAGRLLTLQRGRWSRRLAAALTLSLAGQLVAQTRGGHSLERNPLAAGDSAWDRGARDSAYLHYRSAVARDAGAPTRAVFRLAALESERNRLDAALLLLREYVRREPADDEGRLALARVLAWRGQYDQSVGLYDHVLARDSTYRDAALGRAQTLAWAGKFPAAIAGYEKWLAQSPADSAAELALARALSWAGQLDAAESRYASVARRVESTDAERGIARVAAWRGDLARSETLWRALTIRRPADAEPWIGLAEVQRWAGRFQAADTSLRRALALAPSSASAREAWQQVRAELAGAAEPAGTYSRDSDGNRLTSWTVSVLTRPLGAARPRLTAALRDAAYLGTAAASVGVRAGFSWSSSGGRLSTTTEVGATRLSSRGGSRGTTAHTRPWAVVRLAGRPAPRVATGLSFTAVPFDETATLIAGGIHTSGLEGDLSLTLPKRVSVGMGGGHTRIQGSTLPNARRAFGTTGRWGARAGLTVAAAARGMAYDTTGRTDGYFAPHRFTLVEASVRQTLGSDRGWSTTLEGGAGQQGIQFASGDPTRSNLAARGSLTVRFSPLPGYEVEAAGGASSVASPVALGGSEYSVVWYSLRGRLRIF